MSGVHVAPHLILYLPFGSKRTAGQLMVQGRLIGVLLKVKEKQPKYDSFGNIVKTMPTKMQSHKHYSSAATLQTASAAYSSKLPGPIPVISRDQRFPHILIFINFLKGSWYIYDCSLCMLLYLQINLEIKHFTGGSRRIPKFTNA
jgi:hypothetical protein